VAAEELTMEEDMAQDWAAIREKFAVPEEPPAAESNEPALEQTDSTSEAAPRSRDESGRFTREPVHAKGEKDQSQPAPAVSRVPSKEAGASPEASAVSTDSSPHSRDIARAPSTWKPTARADWDKLPEGIRAEIHRRETDFLNGQSQLLPDAKFGKSVADVVAPYRMLIEAEGGTPERAIADLMRTAATFRVGTPQQKLDALKGIATQFGIDVRQLAPQIGAQPGTQSPAQPSAPQNFQDPRVDQLLAYLGQQNQQREQAEQATLENTVTKWMGETDAAGNPTRPYLGDVMTDMQALVPAIRQGNHSLSHEQVLQTAYERATWGNPEIRALLQQQQLQGSEQARRTENQDRVREARRAASMNVPRRASTPSPGKPGRLEDTIEETARTLGLLG